MTNEGKNPGALSFSFHGRANRAKFCGGLFLLCLLGGLVFGFAGCVLGIAWKGGEDLFDFLVGRGGMLVIAIPILLTLWIWFLSIQVRRLHDHNKSGWFVVAFWALQFVPVIGRFAWLWPFIWLGCMKGTTGPNDYGPDPLQE